MNAADAADTLRDRLLAGLEAATVAAVKAADAERARPLAEAGAPDATGVLAALAHVAYFNRRLPQAQTVATLTRPADWPAPTTEALAAWMLGSPEALPLAVAVAEAALLTPADAWTDRERWAHRAAERWLTDFAPVLPGNRKPSAPLPFAVLFLTDLVLAYLAAGRPHAPLFALIDAWPVLVGADERRHQNVPAKLAWCTNVILHRDAQPHLPFDETDLTQAPRADAARFEVTYLLPEWEPQPSMLPRALLDLLDFGASRGRGGPVPVSQRVGWELLLMPKPREWHAEQATVTPTLDTLGARVWATDERYRRTYHGPLLYQAARWLNDPDNATWFRRNERSRPILVVTFFAPPVAPYNPADTVGAHIVLPDGGRRRGAQYDAPLRRVLAATSYRQHRVYLAAVCLFDRHATVRGHMVQLTLPVVERNPAGYVLRADGEIVTEKGRPTRRATHPLAVQTGARERNPAETNAYPWLEGHDAILAAHHRVAGTPRERNEQRRMTIATLEALRVHAERRRGGGVIVTRGAALDFEARYRGDGVLTGADLADLSERKERPPSHTELEAVRLLPSAVHFAGHQQRRAERKNRRQRRP